MTDIDLNTLKKLYYSIGEVAGIFKVNTSLIRFWEKEFKFEASKKTAKGNRLYTVKDIENFNKIYHLVKIEGFTLEGAKNRLSSQRKNTTSIPKQEDLIQYETTIIKSNTVQKEKIIKKLESLKLNILKLKQNHS